MLTTTRRGGVVSEIIIFFLQIVVQRFELSLAGLPIMFGLNYHHHPSDQGNASVDLFNPDLYDSSINRSSADLFYNSTQTLDRLELTTKGSTFTTMAL